jgi:predicted MFS family arabinose efflux permease
MKPNAKRDLLLIIAAGFVRAMMIGFIGVVLAVMLFRVGFSSAQIGVVIGAGLTGAGIATSLSAIYVDRFGRRMSLCLLSLVAVAPLFALAWRPVFWIVLPMSLLGMLNAMGSDRSAAFAIEQAVLPGLVHDRHRTWTLSWYNVALDAGTAVGALLASLPAAIDHWSGTNVIAGYRYVLSGLGVLGIACGVGYLFLSRSVEINGDQNSRIKKVSPETKRIVTRLSALFSIDAFGGGFLADALISYWFFRRFGVSEQSLGILFAVIHVLNATSHLGAAWLAHRIGLLNTMVFTHIPSSLFLIAVPFAPSFSIAAFLLLCRECLVEMDVPTRQSYTAAVVRPEERTFAAAATNVARNLGWAGSSSLSGIFMNTVSLGAPIFIGSSLKIAYDIALFFSFRSIRPPEEKSQVTSESLQKMSESPMNRGTPQ